MACRLTWRGTSFRSPLICESRVEGTQHINNILYGWHRFSEKRQARQILLVEKSKKRREREKRVRGTVENNTEWPNYSPSTRHLGKALLLWQPRTHKTMEWRHGKREVRRWDHFCKWRNTTFQNEDPCGFLCVLTEMVKQTSSLGRNFPIKIPILKIMSKQPLSEARQFLSAHLFNEKKISAEKMKMWGWWKLVEAKKRAHRNQLLRSSSKYVYGSLGRIGLL